jgi:hypothetical protein
MTLMDIKFNKVEKHHIQNALRKSSLFLICIFINIFSSGQNPLIKKWDYRYGGINSDELSCVLNTNDGGFILGGYSLSGISGDKSQATWGNYDYWIVKIDSLGNKQWDKDYGGVEDDRLYAIQQLSKGGFILGGYSLSGVSGDKTETNWGNSDFWIIKIDSLGNKLWDKGFGGTREDFLNSIQITADDGFVVGGVSRSGISGDKTQANWDTSGNTFDYWVVKIDSLGNKEWDRTFGGTNWDELHSILQTDDEGFILGGWSLSDISGDKSQPSWGANDYWVVKIDSLGNKLWDKDLGGINGDWLCSMDQTYDKGIVLGGYTLSGISGDKTVSNWGNTDYWIIKIDSLGNKLWDRDLGGIDEEDDFGNIIETAEKGFLITGTSYSSISGNKTESNLGPEQNWIIKTDSLGNLLWDKTIHLADHIEKGWSTQTQDGCYLVANFTLAGIAGDKLQSSWSGSNDYWVVKYCDTLQLPIITLTAPNFLCPGSCIDILNLTAFATSYQWSFPGAIPDTSSLFNPTNICYPTSGSFDIQLVASNENGIDTLLLTNYITVYNAPTSQAITQSGDTLFAIAGASLYQWYYNGNILNGATDYFYVSTASGDYNIVATDTNGCEVEAAIFNVIAEVPVAYSDSNKIEIYPNPVQEYIKFKANFILLSNEICVRNMINRKLYPTKMLIDNDNQVYVNVQSLPSGIYILEITFNGRILRSKFVKL